MIQPATILLVCALPLSIVLAADSRQEEPPLVRDLHARLPAGWTCTVHEGKDIKQVPHGLGSPLFHIVVTNTHVSFAGIPNTPTAEKQHPIVPLYFYPRSAKPDIMKIIEKERCYSWNIPVYFGETDEFVVVTSPAYVNGGVFTAEARRALRPAWTVLRELIPKREETQVDELAAEAREVSE